MNKRLLAAVLSFSLILGLSVLISPTIAHADAIIGNEFRWEHSDEMQPLRRTRFCVNGPDGYVNIRAEPGWDNGASSYGSGITYQNGAELHMSCVYVHEGEYWGVMAEGHHVGYPGWIPMDHLLVVYIREDFNNEYRDDFYKYTGNFDAVKSAKRLVLWQWPGADREKRVLDIDGFILTDEQVLHAYKDKQGREWGYVGIRSNYYDRYEWICLSDPENSRIPAFHPAPKPMGWSPDEVYKWPRIDAPDDGAGEVEKYLLSHIARVRTFEQSDKFTDVAEDAWYKDAVITVFEYDIISGTGNNRFNPDVVLTRGEALVIASLIHAYYKYGYEEGRSWIDIYNYTYNFSSHGWNYWWLGAVQYCHAEELVEKFPDDDYFSDFYYHYTAPITRAEMVHVWAKVLQPKDMPKQNTVIALPDVDSRTDYFEDVILFYETGIVGGVDTNGTFNPDSELTRAEAAMIFMNLIDTTKRHSGRTYGS